MDPTDRTTRVSSFWQDAKLAAARRREGGYNLPMILQKSGFGSAALLAVLTTALSAQAPASPPAAQNPNFRLQVDLVTTDVLVRDDKGNFIPDLKSEGFAVYED